MGDNNPIHGVVGCVPWGEQLVLSVERHCANCECAIALDKQNVTKGTGCYGVAGHKLGLTYAEFIQSKQMGVKGMGTIQFPKV